MQQQRFDPAGFGDNRKWALNVSPFKQEIQTAVTKLSKSQAQMIKEREMFSEVTAEMEKALKQAETLLL